MSIAPQSRREADERQFLLDASTALASSLDLQKTLDAVVRLAVPRIADWCAVELGHDPLTSKQVSVAHVDPSKVAFVRALSERYPPDRTSANGVPGALRSGKPELVGDIPEAALIAGAKDAEHLAIIRALRLKSYMVVPLIAHGRTLGALSFVAAESGQTYTEVDLALAQQLAACAALAIDNAALHQKEGELRAKAEAAESRYRMLAEAIPQQVWTATPDGALDFVNQRTVDYFQSPREAVLGAGWQAVIHPDDLPLCVERWMHSLKTHEPYEVEFRLRRGDGAYLWHLGRALPMRDSRGAVDRWFGTNTDIDEKRKTADELKRRAEFEQQLVGIVSHDLRNPLSAMVISATTLLRRETTDERSMNVLRRIINGGERAGRMIRDLLDFTQARLGEGIPVAPVAVNFHQIAQRVVEEHQLTHPERALVFEHAGDGAGSWDPDRMAQAIGNLVSNALHHGDASAPVRVVSHAEADGVRLEVHNGGAPIPAGLLPVLFEPMSRGVNPLDHSQRSIGLGLFIVKQIIDGHGGTISVASNADGTCFTLRVPKR